MRTFIKSMFCTALAVSGFSVTAAPVLNIDSATKKLMGASGVKVGDAYYDVSFGDGSCNSRMNGCTSFVFSSEKLVAAAQALLDQVFLNDIDTQPFLINGCTWEGQCDVYSYGGLAFDTSLKTNFITIAHTLNKSIESDDKVYSYRGLLSDVRTYDTTDSAGGFMNRGYETMAVWSASTYSASVPEPASLALVGAALLGLAANRKTRKLKLR